MTYIPYKKVLNSPISLVIIVIAIVAIIVSCCLVRSYIPAKSSLLTPNLVLVQMNDQLKLELTDGRILEIKTIKDAQTGSIADSCGIHLLMPHDIMKRNISEVKRLLERHQRMLIARNDYLHKQVAELEYFCKTHLKTDKGYSQAQALLAETKQLCSQTDSVLGLVKMAVMTDYKRPTITLQLFHSDAFKNNESTYHDMKSGNTYYGKMVDGKRQGYGKEYSQVDYYQGNWDYNERDGFGIGLTRDKGVCCGTWEYNTFLGESTLHSNARIYGIDISRYQHEMNKRKTTIQWDSLRITSLGNKCERQSEGAVSYPVSFIYIKSTEGLTIKSQHYDVDAQEARKRNIRIGAYHFFTVAPGKQQAQFFLANTSIQDNDMPPVVDVELTDKQIERMGGSQQLQTSLKEWIDTVKKQSGMTPIIYASQTFIETYLKQMLTKEDCPQLWIARYSEYKPYEHHVIWQLSDDGKVNGISGYADIDVFNGSQELFETVIK